MVIHAVLSSVGQKGLSIAAQFSWTVCHCTSSCHDSYFPKDIHCFTFYPNTLGIFSWNCKYIHLNFPLKGAHEVTRQLTEHCIFLFPYQCDLNTQGVFESPSSQLKAFLFMPTLWISEGNINHGSCLWIWQTVHKNCATYYWEDILLHGLQII